MIIAVLFIIITLAFLFLAFRNITLAITLFCALLPSYLLRFSIPLPGIPIMIPTTLLEILFFTIVIAWFFQGGMKSTVWKRLHSWFPGILMLLIGALIGVLISPNTFGALGLFRAYFIEPFFFFVLFVDLIKTAKERNHIIWALGITLAFTGILAIIQKITGSGIPNPIWQAEATRRITGVYGFPNGVGLFSAPLVVLLTGRAIGYFTQPRAEKRPFLALLSVLIAILGGLAILFAVSEGAAIGTIVGLSILGLLFSKTRLITFITLSIGFTAIIFSGPAMHYITSLASLRDDSGSVRRIVWQESLSMLDDHPVFGAGLDGYRETLVPYHRAKHIEIFMYPHSILLNFWSETGIIGVTGFLFLIIIFFHTLIPHIQHTDEWLPRVLLSAMIALLIHGLVDVPFFKNDLAFLVMILFGLAAGLLPPSHSSFTKRKQRDTLLAQ